MQGLGIVRSYKKILHMVWVAVLSLSFVGVLAGCAGQNMQTAQSQGTQEKKTIYATFFPVADLTRRIVGDKMNVETIIQGNQEPHDFELKAQDMAKMTKADLFVYNGAGMEAFIPDLKKTVGADDKFLDLSQGVTLLKKDQTDDDHDQGARGDHEHADPQNLDGVNPHTWLSIKNAMEALDTIYQKVSAIDPENASYYKENYDKSLAEFSALDKKFEETISSVPADKRYFVASHAAFNYLARDYGMKQVAVTGISPEDEPSAAQLATISDFVKKHSISTIFFEGKATPKVAETLARTTGTKTSTLYTMESLTEEEQNMGYLQLMEKNLENLMESFK